MNRDQGEEWRRQPLNNYLNDLSDARIARQYTVTTPLPDPHHSQSHGFRGPPSLSVRTSMQVSGSDHTGHGSLPGLTSTATSARTSSIPSSVGSRQLRLEQRMLAPGNDGTLQVPPPARGCLECPFNLLYCLNAFANEQDWVNHSLTHFNTATHVIGPPKRNSCCFCDATFESHNALRSWALRMEHVQFHHRLGHRLAFARPDFELFKYLYDNKLISDATYKDLRGHSKDRNAEYCDLIGLVPAQPQAPNANMSPPMSPQSPRAAVTETYSPARARREGRRPH